jgi:hypothetical protein
MVWILETEEIFRYGISRKPFDMLFRTFLISWNFDDHISMFGSHFGWSRPHEIFFSNFLIWVSNFTLKWNILKYDITIERKMQGVSNTQDSIQSLSLWAIHHKSDAKQIVDVWLKVVKRGTTIYWLCLLISHLLVVLSVDRIILSFRKPFLSFCIYLLLIWLYVMRTYKNSRHLDRMTRRSDKCDCCVYEYINRKTGGWRCSA